LPTPSEVSERVGEFYDALIVELGRRYVEPTGKSTTEAISEILIETGLLEQHSAEQCWDRRAYVALEDLPKDDDVQNALQMFRATRGTDLGGRYPRDPLLAIKCAALYHDHNPRDPEDKRYKRWSYERLVKELGLDKRASGQKSKNLKRVGEGYVKYGEKLRQKRGRNQGT
jgi:hypothetical protein